MAALAPLRQALVAVTHGDGTEQPWQALLMDRLNRYFPLMLGILRIMTALLFLAHGTQKFLSFPPGERAGSGWAFAHPGAYAGLVELVAGALIALGLFTRPAAFLASGTMAGAYFIGHAPQGFWPVNNGGDAAILYCFIFLYLMFAGPGALSVDAARKAAS
jgi:putative oxidoreductase